MDKVVGSWHYIVKSKGKKNKTKHKSPIPPGKNIIFSLLSASFDIENDTDTEIGDIRRNVLLMSSNI